MIGYRFRGAGLHGICPGSLTLTNHRILGPVISNVAGIDRLADWRGVVASQTDHLTLRETLTVRQERRRVRWQDVEAYVFISPWLIGFLVFTLGPFLASLALSFTHWELLGLPDFIGVQNYRQM